MNTNALLVLLVIIGLVVVTNLVMFALVRGVMRGDNRWIRSLTDSFTKPLTRMDKSYDELRQRMQELSGEQKKDD